MTDRDKLKNLLEEFGVGFTESGDSILCEEGDTKVVGYSGFGTEFSFDSEGKFLQMGAYE